MCVMLTVLSLYSVGLQGALDLQVAEIAIFGAASEAFSQKNINCSIKDSIKRFKEA